MSKNIINSSLHSVPKKRRHQTHSGKSVNSQPIYNFFHCQIFQSICSKYLLKIQPHLTCVATLPCGTLMSENEQHSPSNVVINDKLQRTIKVWWIVNNQIKNGLLLSPPVIFFKSVNIWHSYGQKTGLCRALSSSFSSMVARCTKCTRQPRSCL